MATTYELMPEFTRPNRNETQAHLIIQRGCERLEGSKRGCPQCVRASVSPQLHQHVELSLHLVFGCSHNSRLFL